MGGHVLQTLGLGSQLDLDAGALIVQAPGRDQAAPAIVAGAAHYHNAPVGNAATQPTARERACIRCTAAAT